MITRGMTSVELQIHLRLTEKVEADIWIEISLRTGLQYGIWNIGMKNHEETEA